MSTTATSSTPTFTLTPPTALSNHHLTISLATSPPPPLFLQHPKTELSLSFNDIYLPRLPVKELLSRGLQQNTDEDVDVDSDEDEGGHEDEDGDMGRLMAKIQAPKMAKGMLRGERGEVDVRIYAWRGERLVGEWGVGRYVQSWVV